MGRGRGSQESVGWRPAGHGKGTIVPHGRHLKSPRDNDLQTKRAPCSARACSSLGRSIPQAHTCRARRVRHSALTAPSLPVIHPSCSSMMRLPHFAFSSECVT